MDSNQTEEKPAPPPVALDFGGALGPAPTNQYQQPRRQASQPSLPQPPGDPFKNKPPAYPSLF